MSLIDDAIGLVNKWRDAATGIRPSGTWTGYDLADRYDWCADELDALMPAIRQAMIDAEQLAAVRIRLPTKVETKIMAGMDAEEMAAFDSGYNAALDRAHLLLMASSAPANEALEPDSLGFGARTDAANNRATGEGEGND